MKSTVCVCGILLSTPMASQAEVADEIPLGIEAVTGIRSDFVFRGFDLAGTSLDFQIEAEISLSNESSLNLGLAHLAESSGDFSETLGYLQYSQSLTDKWFIGATLTYRNRNESILSSGFDLAFFADYEINDDLQWQSEIAYDFGESGLFLASQLEWSKVITSNSFVMVEGGISFVFDYAGRDGFNDLFSRVSYTYALSRAVSFTPFLGSNISLGEADDEVFGGLWFEVIF